MSNECAGCDKILSRAEIEEGFCEECEKEIELIDLFTKLITGGYWKGYLK